MSYIEWGVLALFLMLMELFVSGVYLLWFGLAGLLLSVGVYFGLIPTTNSVQLVIFLFKTFFFKPFLTVSTSGSSGILSPTLLHTSWFQIEYLLQGEQLIL